MLVFFCTLFWDQACEKGKRQAANLTKEKCANAIWVGNHVKFKEKFKLLTTACSILPLSRVRWLQFWYKARNHLNLCPSKYIFFKPSVQNNCKVELVKTSGQSTQLFRLCTLSCYSCVLYTKRAFTDRITLPLLLVSGFFASRFLHLPRRACTCPEEEKQVREEVSFQAVE